MLRPVENRSTISRMALEFARRNVISRSAGHTAVKAAAYRAGEKLIDERVGRIANYLHRADEVGHCEILLPESASPEMSDRASLWSAVEAREDQHNRRASAQLAIDNIIALPVELSQDQHIELARAFAQQEYVAKGLVVDLAIHYHSEGNPHAHLMTPTRPLVGVEFGSKDREGAGKFYAGVKIADEVQLRHRWADFQNTFFREHGIDAFVRSNNGEFQAEVHLGPTHAMKDKGIETARQHQNNQTISAREQAILAHPEIVIDRVSDRKSLFTQHDLYRELSRLTQNTLVFSNVKPVLDNHASLIKFEFDGTEYLTTQAILETEMDIRAKAGKLAEPAKRFAIPDAVVTAILDQYSFLSSEQREAAVSLSKGRRLGVVVGLAGAGKSTMLKALREAYEAQGLRVKGITLAGKASEELQLSSGIESRTISSWLLALKQGRETLKATDVITMDEAGMINNSTMNNVLSEIEKAGAKLILVGDGEQLQPIQTGCPFRDIAVQEGFTEIGTIRRQKSDWQREATKDLSEGRGRKALSAYEKHGFVHHQKRASDTRDELVLDYLGAAPGSKIVLAHRNVDVMALNHEIRASLVLSGSVDTGQPFRATQLHDDAGMTTPFDLSAGDDIRFGVDDKASGINAGDFGTYLGFEGSQHLVRRSNGTELKLDNERYGHIEHVQRPDTPRVILGAGDRVLFTKNDRALGVKNGTLGTVVSFKFGRLTVQVDGHPSTIAFSFDEYSSVTLGYATTIHKSQGMTVDRTFVLGSASMDKHLGYVSMSRHTDVLDVYLSDEAMKGQNFGDIISHAKRQETVLDLAETHGLELDPAHPDTFQFTQIPTAREVSMDASNVADDSLDQNSTIDSLPISEVDVADARRIISREIKTGIGALERRHKAELELLGKDVENAKDKLDHHIGQEPGSKAPGMLTGKSDPNRWLSIKRRLEIEHANAKRAELRAIDSFDAAAGQRQFTAEERARKRHPGAAQIIARYDAHIKAMKLVERWSSLANQIDVDERREPNKSSSLRKALDNVLDELAQSMILKNALTKDRVNALDSVRANNKHKLAISHALDKNRGHDI